MSDYNKLTKLIDKEVISLDDLRMLACDDLVTSIRPVKKDKKYPQCLKYEIHLTNEELYWVYIKKI